MNNPSKIDTTTATETQAAVALGKRLVEIRGADVQIDFARLIGVHKNTLARYESGERHPDTEFLRRLAALGYNIHWLVTGMGSPRLVTRELEAFLIQDHDGRRYETESEHAGSFVRLSELRTTGPSQTNLGFLAFARKWLESQQGLDPEALYLVSQQGDSMSPEIVHGDWVMVDVRPQEGSFREGIYLLRLAGNFVIRQVQLLSGSKYLLKPLNPAYRDEIVDVAAFQHADEQEGERILGRVVWRSHTMA